MIGKSREEQVIQEIHPQVTMSSGSIITSESQFSDVLFNVDLQLTPKEKYQILDYIKQIQEKRPSTCRYTFKLNQSLKNQQGIIYRASVINVQFLWINKDNRNYKYANLIQKMKKAIMKHKFILKKCKPNLQIFQQDYYSISPAWTDVKIFSSDELRVYGKIGSPLNKLIVNKNKDENINKSWQKQCLIYQLIKNCQVMHSDKQENNFKKFHCDIKLDNIVLYVNPNQRKYLKKLRQQNLITQQQENQYLKRINRCLFIDYQNAVSGQSIMDPDQNEYGMSINCTDGYLAPEIQDNGKYYGHSIIKRQNGTQINARQLMDIWSLGITIAEIITQKKISQLCTTAQAKNRPKQILQKIQQSCMNYYSNLVMQMLQVQQSKRKTASELLQFFQSQYIQLLSDNICQDFSIRTKIRILPNFYQFRQQFDEIDETQKQDQYQYYTKHYNQQQQIIELYKTYEQIKQQQDQIDKLCSIDNIKLIYKAQQQIVKNKVNNTIRLQLEGLKSDKIKKHIFQNSFQKLQIIIFYDCRLGQIPLINSLKGIKQLSLIRDNLDEIPKLTQFYPNLQILKLKQFQIKTPSKIIQFTAQNLKQLKILYLQTFYYNNLKFSKDISNLKNKLIIILKKPILFYWVQYSIPLKQLLSIQRQSWRNLLQFRKINGKIAYDYFINMEKYKMRCKYLYQISYIQQVCKYFDKLKFDEKPEKDFDMESDNNQIEINISKLLKKMRKVKHQS